MIFLPGPGPSGSDHVIANHVNPGSESTENRALASSKRRGLKALFDNGESRTFGLVVFG